MPIKRIYLAGPDVFLENANEQFSRLKAICADRGLEGVSPLDGGVPLVDVGTGDETAEHIYQANIALIRGCDAVLANLMPFRGVLEPDSGTVFEWGYAVALNKPVAGYLPEAEIRYEDKVARHFGIQIKDGRPYCNDFRFLVETMGQPLNLMLARSGKIFSSAELALHHLAGLLDKSAER